VVDGENSVATRVVKPGASDGDWVEVAGRLKEGERVVIDGVDRLREGAKVEVIAADPAQRAGASAPAGRASGGGGNWRDRVPPEVAAKLEKMSPEERREWFQKRRAASAP